MGLWTPADLQTAAPCSKCGWAAAFATSGSIHQRCRLCNSNEDWHQLLEAIHMYTGNTPSIAHGNLPQLQTARALKVHDEAGM